MNNYSEEKWFYVKSLLNSCEDKEFAKMSLITIQPEFSNMYPSRFLYVDN